MKKFEITNWDIYGMYFGYSRCCIKAFSKGNHIGMPPRKLHGSGYIPCDVCNEKSEETLISEIRKRRRHHQSFPRCNESPDNIKEVFKILMGGSCVV